MASGEQNPTMRCVVVASEARTSITPCGGLEAAMTSAETGAGARLLPFVNFRTDARHDRLVIRPQKREGGGVIANFCPFCGTALTAQAEGFVRADPQEDLADA